MRLVSVVLKLRFFMNSELYSCPLSASASLLSALWAALLESLLLFAVAAAAVAEEEGALAVAVVLPAAPALLS